MAQVQPRVTQATGKRKTAIAQVRVRDGSGIIAINGRTLEDYLVRITSRMVVRQPLEVTETTDRFDVTVSVNGGGLAAQADAIRHGISRALCLINADFRPPLKRAGYLTRDDRIKERKKYGQPGARKRFQYSKR